MDWLFWSVVCMVLMVLSVAAEVLTPSFGVFALVSVALIGVSTWMGFKHSSAAGFIMLALNLALFPTSLWVAIRLLRKGPLTLEQEIQSAAGRMPEVAAPSLPARSTLSGQSGRALTALRPSGAVLIGERRLDAITEGKFLEAGTPVKVIRVEGGTVIVEQA